MKSLSINISMTLAVMLMISTSAWAPNRRAFDHMGTTCADYALPANVELTFDLLGVDPDTEFPQIYRLCFFNLGGEPSLYITSPGQISPQSTTDTKACYLITTAQDPLDSNTFVIAAKLPGQSCFGKILLELDAGTIETSFAPPTQIKTSPGTSVVTSDGPIGDTSPTPKTPVAATGSDPQDPDADGIDNAIDNCPTDFNPSQMDTDADGTGDACDDTISATCINQLGMGASVCCDGTSGKLYHPNCSGTSVDTNLAPSPFDPPIGDAQSAEKLSAGCSLLLKP